MKVFKFIYKATLCATLSATVLTSCVNNWLDLEPSDGVEEHEGITNSDNMGTAVGVVLCILAVIPTIIAGAIEASGYYCGLSVGLLLFILAIGVNLLVRVGMVKSSYDTLLQEGEYTKEEKLFKKKTDTFSGVYWCLTTAIYLAWSFWTMSWDITWIVWPVAGVLFAALLGVVKMVLKNGSETQHYI